MTAAETAGILLAGLISAEAAQLEVCKHLPDLHELYWEYGTMDDLSSKSTLPNPMFLSLNDNATLHPGTNPLLGFHLAGACAQYTSTSPLFCGPTGRNPNVDLVKAAKAEFRAWTTSFTKHAVNCITIRCFVGDALTFALTLQAWRHPGKQVTPVWYCGRYNFEPLKLNSDEYTTAGSAPRVFNIIDTSDLVDHLGTVNVLAATTALLSNDIAASLYVETLVIMDDCHANEFEDRLCGPIPTVSTLLGLLPVEVITNASSSLAAAQKLPTDKVLSWAGGSHSSSSQSFIRTTWKRPLSYSLELRPEESHAGLHLSPRDLAHALFCVYLKMFADEEKMNVFSKVGTNKFRQLSLPRYHRGSFALFLFIVKARTAVDWDKTMGLLRDRIDSSVILLGNFIPELYLWLHLFNVHSVDSLGGPSTHFNTIDGTGDLRSWKSVPPIICVTLLVPRASLKVLAARRPHDVGSPPLQCVVQSSSPAYARWYLPFAAIQLGFGIPMFSGTPHTASFQISMIEDQAGWMGTSPLTVSFYCPTWVLLQEPRTAIVTLCARPTPQSTGALLEELGRELAINRTTLADSEHVFFSERMPNQSYGPPPFNVSKESDVKQQEKITDVKTTITGSFDITEGHLHFLSGRLDIVSEHTKILLSNGSQVQVTSETPFNFSVNLRNGPSFQINFPWPVLESRRKIPIARKSSYIEVVAPIADVSDWAELHSFVFPVLAKSQSVVSWTVPYLNTSQLPVIDTRWPERLERQLEHTSIMFTEREASLVDNKSLPATPGERVRVDFKLSLFKIFRVYFGVQVPTRASIFAITCPEDGGSQILLCISKLQLDLSNRNIVLDAAAMTIDRDLWFHPDRPTSMVYDEGQCCPIPGTKDEMRLWKQALPAWQERCRSWNHTKTCEYLSTGRIPLSVERNERVLCTCGDGVFPADFTVDDSHWDQAKKHMVRVAIAPIFAAAFNQAGPRVEQPDDQEQAVAKCEFCGRKEGDRLRTKALSSCARCHSVFYCSKDCQRADWRKHKPDCRAA